MGLFKQLIMIFGKTGLQGLPTRVTLFLWAFSRQGATGVPLCTTWDSVAGSGRAPRESVLFIGTQFSILYTSMYLETFRARADPGSELSHLGLAPPRDCDLGRFGPGQTWILGPGLRVGGPGSPPFCRMREELCTVRNSDL
jgi:hypothetical protein